MVLGISARRGGHGRDRDHDVDSVQAEEMALKIKGPSGRGRSRALQNENCKLQNANFREETNKFCNLQFAI
jgi:hypothetical protein